uniref:ornithine decarboxylase n=1 Tax=Mayetiola destructor TaxID=39758 RepID=A0A0B4RYF6_MAYDE|nr:ornithine decarboxylase [Mayetiola destructor]
MKIYGSNKLQVIDGPLDAIEEIRLQSKHGHAGEEALYICNVTDIINKHKIWKQSMPRVVPFYAVKCNDSPIVIQTLASLGTGFDCASKGEISKVISHGVAADSIIYANPTKPISHLKFSAEMEVRTMTVDGDFELYKIHKHYPAAELVLRIRCDAKISQCPLGEKYGCDPNTEAPQLIELAKSLNLNMIGISFHVGSGCQDAPIFAKAIHAARKLFDFAETVGYKFNLLDIGGGFPGDKNTHINEIASIVNTSLDLYFPSSDVIVIAEPGRFYVASAYTLACRVHSKREIRKDGKSESMMYFINDGVYGSFNCQLYDHKIVKPITLKPSNDGLFKSSIWGPTCDALDQICESILLPKLNIDDFIIFEDMGAYTIPIASPFNGFPLPRVEYYIERKHLEDINSTTASHEYILLPDSLIDN